MPEVDGLESTRLIRKLGYKEPIVALSAFAEDGIVKQCVEAGVDKFMRLELWSPLLASTKPLKTNKSSNSKPINRKALKEVLKSMCGNVPLVDGAAKANGKS
jgi:osomolarity two-component system sensor histidine kinase SLN1